MAILANGKVQADINEKPSIQFSDLKAQYNQCKTDIDKAIQRVLNDGNYILGKQVFEFEEKFAEHEGYKYGVAVSSGTSPRYTALEIAP